MKIDYEIMDNCDECNKRVVRDLMVNVHSEMFGRKNLNENWANYDGMVCLGCFIRNVTNKEIVFLDEIGVFNVEMYKEGGKTYIYWDEDLEQYLRELNTEFNLDKEEIDLDGYKLKFSVEHRPNRHMVGSKEYNDIVLVFETIGYEDIGEKIPIWEV